MGGHDPEPQSDTQLELISVPNDTDVKHSHHQFVTLV